MRVLTVLGAMFALTVSAAVADPRHLEYGVDRSNLTWETDAVMAKTLADIGALKVQWFRDGITSAGPGNYTRFLQELRLAKAQGLKYLAIVMPKDEDFPEGYKPPNAGPEFAKRCGWPGGSFEVGKVDLSRFKARLGAELDAVKAAGLAIDAFEIGNEYVWMCFDGDVPDGHEASPEELGRFVEGYARFLKAAATAIEDPSRFPNAQVITFGLAHVLSSWEVGHHISNSGRILEMLRNLDGVDYLNNSGYKIAGVGLHLYPSLDAKPEDSLAIVEADSRAAGNLPVWITEWGFNREAFKTRHDITRTQAIARFCDVLEHAPQPLGPNFFYAYAEPGPSGFTLIGDNGTALPEAAELSRQAQKR
jgi:hypothetical protein